jgi:hypothetical protein
MFSKALVTKMSLGQGPVLMLGFRNVAISNFLLPQLGSWFFFNKDFYIMHKV